MTEREADGSDPPTDRESPVGEPVVRGDHAREALVFDPDDPASLDHAATVAREFVDGDGTGDSLAVLRASAATAALVRGEGSYLAAANRIGDDVTVGFIRKWARVHDLPRSIRRLVAAGAIAPTAAKHIARVEGDARFLLAWATIDHDLTVREVRVLATEIDDGTPAEDALREAGAPPGEIDLELPTETYRELRRRAALAETDPDELVGEALEEYFRE